MLYYYMKWYITMSLNVLYQISPSAAGRTDAGWPCQPSSSPSHPSRGIFFFSIKNNFASIANNTFWVLYVINSFICLQKMSFLPQFILPTEPLQHTTCSNIATIAFKLYKYYSVPCKYYSYLSLFSSYIFVSYKHFFLFMYA